MLLTVRDGRKRPITIPMYNLQDVRYPVPLPFDGGTGCVEIFRRVRNTFIFVTNTNRLGPRIKVKCIFVFRKNMSYL